MRKLKSILITIATVLAYIMFWLLMVIINGAALWFALMAFGWFLAMIGWM